MYRFKLIIPIIVALILFSAAASATETLTLSQCIQIALENQYDMRIAKHNLNSYDLNFCRTFSVFYPQVTLSANYGYSGIEDSDPANAYSATLSATQYIFDFGKSFREVGKAAASNKSYHASFESTRQGAIYNVIYYYYSYLRQKHLEALNLENLNTAKSHLEKAKAFLRVGIKSRIDVTQAEVTLANAEFSYLKAQNSLRLARLNLVNSFGYKSGYDFEVVDIADTSPFKADIESCITEAARSRPDVVQAKASLEAAKTDLNNAINFYSITLSAKGNLTYSGVEMPLDKTWGWGAYAVLSVPIFDGFSTWQAILSAKENLKAVEVEREKLDFTIRSEIEIAYLSNSENYEAISVAGKSVEQAKENFDLAEARYQNGVGSSIELNDATASLLNAQVNYVQSVYDYAISIANLKKAMGTIHE